MCMLLSYFNYILDLVVLNFNYSKTKKILNAITHLKILRMIVWDTKKENSLFEAKILLLFIHITRK